jgi:hypothetical protein
MSQRRWSFIRPIIQYAKIPNSVVWRKKTRQGIPEHFTSQVITIWQGIFEYIRSYYLIHNICGIKYRRNQVFFFPGANIPLVRVVTHAIKNGRFQLVLILDPEKHSVVNLEDEWLNVSS